MRFDRVLIFSLLLPLAGCMTTRTDSNSLGKNMPEPSKADQTVDAARIHTELAQRYMDSGDLQTALEKVTKALQFDPNYAPAHTVIAVIYERINQAARSRAALPQGSGAGARQGRAEQQSRRIPVPHGENRGGERVFPESGRGPVLSDARCGADE